MRETSFIKQNKEKWKEFEQILHRQQKDPDKLNKLFVQITDDLSYSRTFYPNRSVRVYLNSLAQQIFQNIYRNKKSKRNRLLRFWTDELPYLVHQARREFRLALLLFVLAFSIGALSSAMDPEFPRVILGDAYVDMTIENIESGDPMAVYKQKGAFGMSMGITLNNLYVAFLTFILGVFFAIGSAFILIKNAIMVGAFQYFFLQKGLFLESFLTIWIHGTLEISAIIIAGAAGFTMGRGLLFPGTYARLQAFQLSARRGLKIMLGIVPLLLMAGFFEGYLTRHTEAPDLLRAFFIFICLAFVLFYFVWFPWYKSKRGFESAAKENKLPPDRQKRIDFSRIKSSGAIFSEVFVLVKKYPFRIALTALGLAALFCLASYSLASGAELDELFRYRRTLFGTVVNMDQFFKHEALPFMPVFNIVLFSLFTLFIYQILLMESKESGSGRKWSEYLLDFFKIAPVVAAMQYIMTKDNDFSFFVVLIVFPVLMLWMYVMLKERINIFRALSRTFLLFRGNYSRMIGLFFLMTCISILFISITDTSLLSLYIEAISFNFPLDEEGLKILVNVMLSFITVSVLSLMYGLMLLGAGLLYHTLLEIKDATHLKARIQSIGIGKQIKGMEKEL